MIFIFVGMAVEDLEKGIWEKIYVYGRRMIICHIKFIHIFDLFSLKSTMIVHFTLHERWLDLIHFWINVTKKFFLKNTKLLYKLSYGMAFLALQKCYHVRFLRWTFQNIIDHDGNSWVDLNISDKEAVQISRP